MLLVGRYGSNTSDDLRLPGTDSQAASDLLAARFPPQQNGASPIVFHAASGRVTDSNKKQAIERARAAIVQLPHVYSATDPFSQKGQAQRSKIVKEFGVRLSVGVALAATLVLTLAPAILVILGRASWWLPPALDRRMPHVDIEGSARHSGV